MAKKGSSTGIHGNKLGPLSRKEKEQIIEERKSLEVSAIAAKHHRTEETINNVIHPKAKKPKGKAGRPPGKTIRPMGTKRGLMELMARFIELKDEQAEVMLQIQAYDK